MSTNFEVQILKKLHELKVKTLYRKFIVQGEVFILSADPTLLAEKLGLLSEFLDHSKSLERSERVGFWANIHERYKVEVKNLEIDNAKNIQVESGFKLLIDTSSTGKDIRKVYDLRKNSLASITWEALEAFDKTLAVSLKNTASLCEFYFDPYQDRPQVVEGEIWAINSYIDPIWKQMEVKPQIPELILRLRDHLFKDFSLEYAEKWLYKLLTGQNLHYLVLNGSLGIGKGLWATLCQNLVGFENATTSTGGFLNSNFNLAIRGKKLMFLDEEIVSKGNKHRIKKYINAKLAFEGKGLNPTGLETNFCNFIIANNNVTDLSVEGQDRRFAVMELTATPLTKVMTAQDIRKLSSMVETPNSEEIAQYGKYILERYKDFEEIPQDPPKGPTFWRLAYFSRSEWERFIIDKRNLGEVKFSALRRMAESEKVDHFPKNEIRIEDFVKNCIVDGTSLGVVLRQGKDTILRYTQEYDL